jgi:TonB family protein
MSVQLDNRIQSSLSSRLGDALRKANEGNYDRAIEIIGEISAVDTRNTYMIAFQRQIQKLRSLDQDRSPSSQDQRRQILLTIPAIFEHAVANSREHEGTLVLPSPGGREKALEQVKRQYLRKADEFMEKGDYEHALAEIRRANIVHPDDPDVKNYEARITQIVALQHLPSTEEAGPSPPAPPEIRSTDPTGAATIIAPSSEEAAPVIHEEIGTELVIGEPQQARPKFWLAAATLALLLVVGSLYLHLSGGGEERLPVQSPNENSTASKAAAIDENASGAADQSNDEVPVENISISPPAVIATRSSPRQSPAPTESEPREPLPNVRKSQPTRALDLSRKQDVPDPLFVSQRLPSLVRFVPPEYPEIAKSLGLEGSVKLRVKIGIDGKPIQIRIIESSSQLFNDAAIEAIRRSQFSPGMMPSGPVSSWVTIPVVFKKN